MRCFILLPKMFTAIAADIDLKAQKMKDIFPGAAILQNKTLVFKFELLLIDQRDLNRSINVN